MQRMGHIRGPMPLIISILLMSDMIGDKFVESIMISTTTHGANDTNTILKIEFNPSERSLISAAKSARSTPKKARSASTSVPHNGSMFGKRSLDNTFKQRGTNQSKHIYMNSPNTKILDQNIKPSEDQLSRYNDIITNIIEEFMARNKEGKCIKDLDTLIARLRMRGD